MSVFYPLPSFFTFTEWAERVVAVAEGENIPFPSSKQPWNKWAERLITLPSYAAYPVPLEMLYPGDDGWKLWAEEFIKFSRS